MSLEIEVLGSRNASINKVLSHGTHIKWREREREMESGVKGLLLNPHVELSQALSK